MITSLQKSLKVIKLLGHLGSLQNISAKIGYHRRTGTLDKYRTWPYKKKKKKKKKKLFYFPHPMSVSSTIKPDYCYEISNACDVDETIGDHQDIARVRLFMKQFSSFTQCSELRVHQKRE